MTNPHDQYEDETEAAMRYLNAMTGTEGGMQLPEMTPEFARHAAEFLATLMAQEAG